MKTKWKSIKPYLLDFVVVTAGVLIALFLNNFKDSIQARKYNKASIVTINNEIKSNHEQLKGVVEMQSNLLDTINKYSTDDITLSKLILEKGGGIASAPLSNSGLEFYKRNQLNLIDFDMMSQLITMENVTSAIDIKMEKLMDYLYPNLFADSEESKKLFALHLTNLLGSEIQLIQQYEEFIDKYVDGKR